MLLDRNGTAWNNYWPARIIYADAGGRVWRLPRHWLAGGISPVIEASRYEVTHESNWLESWSPPTWWDLCDINIPDEAATEVRGRVWIEANVVPGEVARVFWKDSSGKMWRIPHDWRRRRIRLTGCDGLLRNNLPHDIAEEFGDGWLFPSRAGPWSGTAHRSPCRPVGEHVLPRHRRAPAPRHRSATPSRTASASSAACPAVLALHHPHRRFQSSSARKHDPTDALAPAVPCSTAPALRSGRSRAAPPAKETIPVPALALLVEDRNRLLPTRLRRGVQLAQVAQRPLPRPFRRAHRLHQRPVAVLLAILLRPQLAQVHNRKLPAIFAGIKRVGLHYIAFPNTSVEHQELRNAKP